MRYLGGICGTGTVEFGRQTLSLAQYDIESYVLNPKQFVGSGEIRMPSESLKKLFGRSDLHLLTHDGKRIKFHFSEKQLSGESQSAHIAIVATDNFLLRNNQA